MFLWRKFAERRWLNAHEDALQARTQGALVVVSRPGSKYLRLEIACRAGSGTQTLVDEFGGRAAKLPRNWLKECMRAQTTKRLRIGSRLVILRGDSPSTAKRVEDGKAHLLIPAGAAFGTGDHVTTSMSLRLLEHVTRRWTKGWSLVDLGTGSGILALAAKRLGAGHATGVDDDPTAISTAKSNARLNKISNVHFHLGDARKWKPGSGPDVVTANLYSDLLIQILPNFNRPCWLILSGILRKQERALVRAIRRNKIKIIEIKRSGKWVAVLARSNGAL